ncbi:VOC family protein [Cupriavidus sp. 2KB_3]|uniref:VOC family protein n=1 Tax=Cupriavidus TaxID=106589 RepID=UPI0011F04781|nr:VOC family protein [Cupriavidus campinensis]
MQVQPYLDFGGRFDEAMAFYGKVLDAKVTFLMRYKEAPPGEAPASPAWGDKVMHANIQIGDSQIMASDGREGEPYPFSGFMLSVGYVPNAEGKRIFEALAEGGRVLMPYQKTFWAEGFGMLVDKFGMSWMVNCEH